MKDSHQTLVFAGVSIIIAIIFIGLSRTNIPSPDNPFLTAQAFFTMGFLFFGFSLGLLVAISYIIRIEKKIP